MRVIIAGGRKYKFDAEDIKKLDSIASQITAVLSGKCSGADREGEVWAKSRGIPVEDFWPDWTRYGLSAGPIRNSIMVDNADALVLFNGNKGTRDVLESALKKNLIIFDFRKDTDPFEHFLVGTLGE